MPGLEISFELPTGWEKSEASNEIPYYLDHNREVTQWDHPAITKAFTEFEHFDEVKYSAYRTSMKIRLIQTMTNMHLVKVKNITDASENPKIFNARTLSVGEVELLLTEIFSNKSIKEELSVELTLNILLKCLDSGRTGILSSHAVLVVLLALCSGTPAMKFKTMFGIVSRNQEGLSKANIRFIMDSILSITECINEGEYFGRNDATSTVNSCKLKDDDCLTESEFLEWLSGDPQVLVWLSTLNRLVLSETVKHEAKCSICKEFPIVGLRFRCLKCFNTDICQNCFLTRKNNRTHKFTHPTKEYCLATTSTDDFKDLIKQVKNKVTRHYRHLPRTDAFLYPQITHEKSTICDLFEVHEQVKSLAVRLQEEVNADTVSTASMKSEHAEFIGTRESIGIQNTGNFIPCHNVLQTSTAELLDKGVSVSTLDDFALIGDEDDLLLKMTKRMLSIFHSNVNWNNHTQSLLFFSSQVSRNTLQFVNSLK